MNLDLLLRSIACGAMITCTQAQQDTLSAPQGPTRLGPDTFVAPIHTAEDDNGHRYGVWASGRDYKMSFHDGAAFYPVLGASAPENLPLRWAETQVQFGNQVLESMPRVEVRRTDWRIEFRVADGVIEAYDVRPEGVEQTFILERSRHVEGDLVIRGKLDSKLKAVDSGWDHASLLFKDQKGASVVSYGAATVFDASGASLRIDSRHQDGAIELRVPGSWLQQATYPVVVDPLLTSVVVAEGGVNLTEVVALDIATRFTGNRTLFAFTRFSSASDTDTFARVSGMDFASSSLIFTDVTDGWATPRTSCAYVGDTDKWIIVVERSFASPAETRIRWHGHPGGDLNLSTAVGSLALPAGETNRYADVGSSPYSNSNHPGALLVYQADVTASNQNTNSSEVYGVIIDTSASANGTASARFPLSMPVAGSFDREFPCVNQAAGPSTDPWIVGYQERSTVGGLINWRLKIARVSTTGNVEQTQFSTIGVAPSSEQSERIQIAGRSGRYMATFIERTSASITNPLGVAPRLRAAQFDWSAAAGNRSVRALRTIVDSPTDLVRNGTIAYDSIRRSHWGVSYELNTSGDVYAMRLGFNAGIAESARLFRGSTSKGSKTAVALSADGTAFTFAYATDQTRHPVYANVLSFNNSSVTTYGTGCGSGHIAHDGMAHAGTESFSSILVSATPNTAASLVLSLGMAALPLGPIGMPGCVLNVDPNLLLMSIGTTTDATGFGSVEFPLPAPLNVDLFVQFAYLAPRLNPLGLGATGGLQISVR